MTRSLSGPSLAGVVSLGLALSWQVGCSDNSANLGDTDGSDADASTGGSASASGGTATATGGSSSSGGTASGGSGTGGDSTAVPGWELIWNDEFDGAAGTTVDSSKWSLDTGPNLNNAELQYYTTRTENAAHDGNGHFIITALKEPYEGYDYTSAKFTSWGKFTPTYGRFEARIRMPRGQGMWPAFWALGTNIGDVGWPQCGELDIMESIGSTMSVNHGSLHGPGYSGGNPLTGTYTLSGDQDLGDDFHVYTLEWEQDVTRFYVDGNLYETRTPADVPGGSTWVFDHDIFMILNVAVGGTWPGDPDDSIFPQTMSIDYVRVYQR